ncbi:MAG TPA: hypothetical protein VG841_04985 [Caulobacterales bacterium]|nr:hypothetical protein [Caulobacterales bacterium]
MENSNRPPSWTSLIIVGIPIIALGAVGIGLVLTSPADVPLWENGQVKNGQLAAGLGVLLMLAYAFVRALSRIAERYFDRD